MRYLLFGLFMAAPAAAPLCGAIPETLQKGQLFHLGFEDTLTADLAQGSAFPAESPPEAQFEEGVSGRGVVLGAPSVKKLRYRHEKNIALPQGTIAFWVKPVDWNGQDALLFQLGISTEGYLGLQVVSSAGKAPTLMFYSLNFQNPERKNVVIRADDDWADGMWRLIVLTWDETAVKLYTDRGLAGEATLSIPYEPGEIPWEFFYLGGSDVTTVMDEFRIWDRALSIEEIFALRDAEAPKP